MPKFPIIKHGPDLINKSRSDGYNVNGMENKHIRHVKQFPKLKNMEEGQVTASSIPRFLFGKTNFISIHLTQNTNAQKNVFKGK